MTAAPAVATKLVLGEYPAFVAEQELQRIGGLRIRAEVQPAGAPSEKEGA